MPRNGTGVMSVLSTFSPGTTISSAQMNTLLADIATELTNSDPRDGSVARTGPANLGGNYAEASGIAMPSAPAAGKGRSYWRTVGGVSRPFARLSDGKEYEQINYVVTPQQFGAKADGVTDDTAAIQAAINAADAFAVATLPSITGYIATAVFFPPGHYLHSGLTSTKPHYFFGAGKSATFLKLATAANAHFWVHSLPGSAGGPTAPHYFQQPVFRDMTWDCNKVGQSGSWDGLNLPSTAWSINTAYSVGAFVERMEVHNASGAGIRIGLNRNYGIIKDTTVKGCGDKGIANQAFDWRVYANDVGSCAYGYSQDASGGTTIWGCNFYLNKEGNVNVDPGVTTYVWFTGCSIDLGEKYGAIVKGNSNTDSFSVSFSQCRFNGNSSSANNTYPDIHVENAFGVSVTLSQFYGQGTNRPNYLVNVVGGGKVFWVNNYHGDAPFVTALANDLSKLVLAGDKNGQIGLNAGGNLRLLGTNTNDAAAAGDVGQIIEAAVNNASAINLVDNTATNITSISLPAGDWDVSGSVTFKPAANTQVVVARSSISLVSATEDSTPGRLAIAAQSTSFVVPGDLFGGASIGPTRISLASTTTVYLVARSDFAVSTCDAYGNIRARRVR